MKNLIAVLMISVSLFLIPCAAHAQAPCQDRKCDDDRNALRAAYYVACLDFYFKRYNNGYMTDELGQRISAYCLALAMQKVPN